MKRSGPSLSFFATCRLRGAWETRRCTATECCMSLAKVHIEMRRGSRSHRLKETVLAAFWEPAPSIRARLSEFSARDWERATFWLAVSGLALYFLDRLTTLGLEDSLPPTVLA